MEIFGVVGEFYYVVCCSDDFESCDGVCEVIVLFVGVVSCSVDGVSDGDVCE